MKKLAIVLAAFTVLGAATPASAQWGGYGYRSWWGGPRAEVFVHRRPHVVIEPRRHFRPYRSYGYGYRSWWGGY